MDSNAWCVRGDAAREALMTLIPTKDRKAAQKLLDESDEYYRRAEVIWDEEMAERGQGRCKRNARL
jgi:hypothetical protein